MTTDGGGGEDGVPTILPIWSGPWTMTHRDQIFWSEEFLTLTVTLQSGKLEQDVMREKWKVHPEQMKPFALCRLHKTIENVAMLSVGC